MSTDLITVPVGTPTRPGVLRLEVVTPMGIMVRADVDTVEAPSVDGQFGVLPGHVALLAALRAGVVSFRSAGHNVAVAVGPGFADTLPDRMTILTDRFVDGREVDLTAARNGLEASQQRLNEYTSLAEGAEWESLTTTRDWAQAQIDAARATGRI